MRTLSRQFPLLVVLMLACSWAIAAEATTTKAPRPDRGYWFYEDPPKKPKAKKVRRGTVPTARAPLGPLPPYKDLMDAHPADLRQIFTERLEEAVWRPTPKNVYAFMLVKDVARRKALAVTQMHSYLLLKYPKLNMNSVRAVSTFARDTEAKEKQREIARALARERNRFALIYFRSDSCVFCKEQDGAIHFFQIRTGWQVKEVDVNRMPSLAHQMNIEVTPSIILIKRGSEDYMPVAVGATATTDLEGNVYRGMRLLKGQVTPEQFFMYEFDKGGLMDPNGDPTQHGLPLMEVRREQ